VADARATRLELTQRIARRDAIEFGAAERADRGFDPG
jgi:hypothetical protein